MSEAWVKMQEWVKMQMVHNAEGDLWCEKTLIILDSKENILIMLSSMLSYTRGKVCADVV